jgi:hypothetical protein
MTDSETKIRPGTASVEPPAGKTIGASGTGRRATGTASRLLAGLAMVIGAFLVAATAVIHLHLWKTGYRHIPTIGPLFLLQAIGGFVLAVVVALWHRWYVAGVGALFLMGTAAGLVVSAQWGLFGFKDSFSAPYAALALFLELAGAAVLMVVAGFLVRRQRAGRGPGGATLAVS